MTDDRNDPWLSDQQAHIGRFSLVADSVLASGLHSCGDSAIGIRLRHAVAGRGPIERGIGFLMARRGVTAPHAFEILARSSRRSGRPIGETVAALMASLEEERQSAR